MTEQYSDARYELLREEHRKIKKKCRLLEGLVIILACACTGLLILLLRLHAVITSADVSEKTETVSYAGFDSEASMPTEESVNWVEAAVYGNDWILVQGRDILRGIEGIETEDTPGKEGDVFYFHLKFAKDADGNGMSENYELPYIGGYVSGNPPDHADTNYYTWQPSDVLDPSKGLRADWFNNRNAFYYLHIAYAMDENGADFSVSDGTGRAFIGYYIDAKVDDSIDSSSYHWIERLTVK